ncbi:Uu.00g024390.m01.CDS01 [Anthostomella pinea]|uniref:tetrahydrofolate synthase n=1 Tax=Anthostomella pinea TaxID=933095 RepID=A0AAI8W0R7_9PEZI|nr:Uu.00g024390.m01.CDS01 [Anthostomella pinea]
MGETRVLSIPGGGGQYILALTSLHAFVGEGVDVAIVETHHGGEFDATNVIPTPVITVITPIGIDHVAQLGPTVENIAWHKAGIFKPGSSAYSSPQTPEVASVLADRAKEKKINPPKFVEIDNKLHRSISLPDVQWRNCSLAREVCDAFLKVKEPGSHVLHADDILCGLHQFRWPGRFEVVRHGENIWFLDGAHNELSVGEAAKWFSSSSISESDIPVTRVLVFSQISTQRDGFGVLQALARSITVPLDTVIITSYETARNTQDAFYEDKMKQYAQDWKCVRSNDKVELRRTVDEAVDLAKTVGQPGRHILVTGSLYLVSEAIRTLQ